MSNGWFSVLFRPRNKVMGLLTRIKGEDTHLATKLTKQKCLWSSPILIPYLDVSPTIPEQTILIVNILPPISHLQSCTLSTKSSAEKEEHPVSDWVYRKVFGFGRWVPHTSTLVHLSAQWTIPPKGIKIYYWCLVAQWKRFVDRWPFGDLFPLVSCPDPTLTSKNGVVNQGEFLG